MKIKDKNFNHRIFSDCGVTKLGVTERSVLGCLLLLLYINDLSKIIIGKSKPTSFADDTSIIFIYSNLKDFKHNIKIGFESLNKWFKANRLSLHFDKTHFMQLTIKNKPQIDLDISYANKLIYKAYDINFLRIRGRVHKFPS